jgi:hypothetical protein
VVDLVHADGIRGWLSILVQLVVLEQSIRYGRGFAGGGILDVHGND